VSAAKTLRVGVWVAAVLAPVQIFFGDLHGLKTLAHQPAKIAAMEALWTTQKGAPLMLLAYFVVLTHMAGKGTQP
jgi:cytochrome d ubiquinol oxidase subunit I